MNKLLQLVVLGVFSVIGLMGGQYIGKVYAVTVNPASNVLGDSANTGTTLVYRTSDGDFSARDISSRGLIASDTSASRAHIPALSSTTLITITPTAAGDLYMYINSLNASIGLCHSTGTTQAAIVLSSAPTLACRQQ